MIRRPSIETVVAMGLIIFGASIRIFRDAGLVSLPPNVAPIAAMALLSGAVLPRRLIVAVPLAAMLASDLVIGFYSLPVMVAVYAAFSISNYFGTQIRGRIKVSHLAVASIIGSITFFLITNAAVWAFQKMYSPTLFGLGQSYLAGLPFFKNTLFGDLVFTGILFGAYQVAAVLTANRKLLLSGHRHD